MKKWIFFGLTALLLAGGLLGLVFFHDVQQPPAPTTEATTSQPASEAPITVPTVATEPTAPAFDASLLSARHAFVYEPAADTLHFTRGDQQEAISPASLTKLMTAFVAMRHLDPKATVAVGYEAKMIAKDSSIAAVSPGTVLEVEMILQGMLMQSGNDAAYVLAVAAGRAIAENPSLDAQAALDIFMEVSHEYPDMTVHLILYNAVIDQGTIQLFEHVDARWVSPQEIPQYDFCPADKEILERIIENAKQGKKA